MQITKDQQKYIEEKVRDGTPLIQAMAEAEVLQEEYNFKQMLISALNDPKVITNLKSALEWDGDRE